MASASEGFLVLADISGFTAFLTTTELEHGPAIIAALLEAVMARLAPPLDIEAIEGDAVFAVDGDGRVAPPARLLDVLDDVFVAFRAKRRELEADDSCACNVCANVARLRLKAIGHYGSFVRQTVGGRAHAAGPEVILAHRLLKNAVPRKADYALLTRAALERMGVDPRRGALVPHVERYEHFGPIECFVREVAVETVAVA
jgi:uncharacterized protein DUF2652